MYEKRSDVDNAINMIFGKSLADVISSTYGDDNNNITENTKNTISDNTISLDEAKNAMNLIFGEDFESQSVSDTHRILYGFDKLYPGCSQTVRSILLDKDTKPIYIGSTNADTIEEIVRRGGKFYRAIEVRELIPWEIQDKDIHQAFVAGFPYKDGEPMIVGDPKYAEYDWLPIVGLQYSYGKYLQKQIADGILSIENIIDVSPADKIHRFDSLYREQHPDS